MSDTFAFPTSDGASIEVYRWLPEGQPKAVLQIEHGASEHAGRYARLAAFLNPHGYAVYADDHRAHGRTAGDLERFGLAPEGSWDRILQDTRELTEHLAATHPGVPLVLLGHSMGSFIAQGYLQRFGNEMRSSGLIAAVLTGTAGSPSPQSEGLRERIEAAVAEEGRDVPSMTFAMLFADFNDPFTDTAPESGPTGFEWLSRDPEEVQRYVDDPWCGLPLSNGFVADLAVGMEEMWEEGAEERLPKDVPVLIMAGDKDPVGESGENVRGLTQRYRAAGIDTTEILYEGARHEIFNETNRDQVHQDLLAWLDGVVAARQGASAGAAAADGPATPPAT